VHQGLQSVNPALGIGGVNSEYCVQNIVATFLCTFAADCQLVILWMSLYSYSAAGNTWVLIVQILFIYFYSLFYYYYYYLLFLYILYYIAVC